MPAGTWPKAVGYGRKMNDDVPYVLMATESRNVDSRGPFYLHGLTLTPAWISNYMHYKVWDEIT